MQSAKDRVSIPKRMDGDDRQRAQERRTWVPPLAPDAGAATFETMRPRDPLYAAVTAKRGESAVVVEANAIRHSKLGELLVDCMNRRGELDKFVEQSGIDPRKDLDRVAASERAVIFSGDFSKARFAGARFAESTAPYGDHATFFRPGANGVVTLSDGGTRLDPRVVVKWKDQLIAFADDEEAAKTMVDRLEGRLPADDVALDESLAYGEV